MTFLSCLAIGIAFAIAVGLLVFAGVLLGWVLPCSIARGRRAGRESAGGRDLKESGRGQGEEGSDLIDPPGPRA